MHLKWKSNDGESKLVEVLQRDPEPEPGGIDTDAGGDAERDEGRLAEDGF